MGRALGWITACCLLLLSPCAWASSHSRHVLIISSFGRAIPAQTILEQGLQRTLPFAGGENDIVFEFMDAPRVPPEQAADPLAALIAAKYAGQQWDAVVAWGPVASRFVTRHAAIFGQSPRFHIETAASQLATMHLSAQDVAIPMPNDYATSIATALDISHPETLFVIASQTDATGKRRLEQFEDGFKSLKRKVNVEYLLDLPLTQLEGLLAKLPANAAVYYLLMFSDGAGTRMTPYAVAERLSAASKVPIFSQWESLMGSGIAGGYLLSHDAIGANLGETIRSWPDQSALAYSPLRQVYDWQALDRWGISQSALPADAVLMNRPRTLWQQYRWHVSGVAVVLVLLCGLSLILIRALYAKRAALAALDIQRRGLADEVAERTRELSRSNHELESFAFAVSHDLRAPLRAIVGYSTLLGRKLANQLDGEAREYIGFVTEGAKRMDGMITGLLEYSRVSAHTADTFALTDLKPIILNAIQPLGLEAHDCGATITMDIPDNLPQVPAERALMTRLFQNLAENALKYRSPERPLQMSISVCNQGTSLLATIEDNGIGVPPEQSERIFGLFQRLSTSQGGYGIGLALCQRIAQIHNGELWLEPLPHGPGCRFRLRLPVSPQQNVKADPEQHDEKATAEH